MMKKKNRNENWIADKIKKETGNQKEERKQEEQRYYLTRTERIVRYKDGDDCGKQIVEKEIITQVEETGMNLDG